jgi:hypothetical protein
MNTEPATTACGGHRRHHTYKDSSRRSRAEVEFKVGADGSAPVSAYGHRLRLSWSLIRFQLAYVTGGWVRLPRMQGLRGEQQHAFH